MSTNNIDEYVNKSIDKIVFRLMVIALLISMLGYLGIFMAEKHGMKGIDCFVYSKLGFYCPGCGGTRAFMNFFQGHFLKSLWYHPLVPFALFYMIIFVVSHFIQKLSGNRIKIGFHFHESVLYFALFLIGFNFIFKNVLLLLFHIAM